MRIQPRKNTDVPPYPSIESLSPRLGLLAGMGLVIISAGCPWDKGGVGPNNETDTDQTVDSQDTWRTPGETGGNAHVASLPQSGSRTLDFAYPEGWMSYHLVIAANDDEFLTWLEDNGVNVLDQVDLALLKHPLADFASDDLSEIDDELRHLVGAAWERATGGSDGTGHIKSLRLRIDDYQATDKIDGDVAP